jgi:hypothetical protein
MPLLLPHPLRALSFALALLLVTGNSQALTLAEMRSKEALESPVLAPVSNISRYDSKYAFLISVWKKDGLWGVVSEQQLQDHDKNKTYTPKASWLVPPEFEQALVARTGRGYMSHVWLKPKGEIYWQAFRTDGKKLTALGSTPYTSMRLIREGRDTRSEADRANPAADRREAYRLLVLGIHDSQDPASATVDLIDAADNRVLMGLSQVDTRTDPRDEDAGLVFRHDAAANGYTIVRLTKPQLLPEAKLKTPPEETDFYREISLDEPVLHALDATGRPVILDRDLRPFSPPGLTLGKPEPLRQGSDVKTRDFRRVPVTTASGQTGYQLIYRNKVNNPELAPTLWREIFEDDQGLLIAQTADKQWRSLYWTPSFNFYPHAFDLAGTRLVTGNSVEALYVAIAEWERSQAEHKRRYEQETQAWLAQEPERARQRAADLQRRIDANAKARLAAEAEYQRQKARSDAEFAARNKSSWGNLQTITLPTLQGAPGLSTLEKDHYDNRGNARNPYVIREKRQP